MKIYAKARINILLAVALLVLLTGCTKSIKIGDGKFSEDSTEITAVISDGETEKLGLFPSLTHADLSGSSCYEEIFAWEQAHPDVDVHFTITFPDGTTADNKAQALALPGLESSDVEEVSRLLGYMSDLKQLSLEGSALSCGDVRALNDAFPEVELSYSFELLGQTVDYQCESLSLVGLSSQDAQAAASSLSQLPRLETVDLGSESVSSLSWDDIALLESSCPNVTFDYDFTLYGLSFSLSSKEMDLNHIPIADDGALVSQVAACMPALEYLDMDSCGVSSEAMAAIRDANPDVNVVWRIWFGDAYSVRTDVERILASKPTEGGNLTVKNTVDLKYCTKVKYMDIGHNEILGEISFVQYMPDLEVLIAAMDGITDISPLSACTKLEYLELQTNSITDISALAPLVNLEHLNIARNGSITDLTPLYGMTKLERLWLGASSSYPQDQIAEIQSLVPDCVINTYVYTDPTEGGWRYTGSNPNPEIYELYKHERYEELLEQFDNYDLSAYSFYWNDPKCY
jgi:Leucine-rich repeat (LRR) protein